MNKFLFAALTAVLVFSVTVTAAPGDLKWKYKTGGAVKSSPAIGSDGTVYFGSWDSCFYALTPKGTLKWRYKTGCIVSSSPAIGSDGTVYFGSCDSNLYALTPQGGLKWNYKTGGFLESSPSIAPDGTVYFWSFDSCLYALSHQGTLKWKFYVDGETYSSPALALDGTIYAASLSESMSGGTLYEIDPDGSERWQYEQPAALRSSPVLWIDETIYISDLLWYLLSAITPGIGLKWFYGNGIYSYSSPAIAADGTIYAGSQDSCLYALHPDCTFKWRYRTQDAVMSSPAVGSDGTVYFGSEDYYIYALNPDGTLQWRYKTGRRVNSSPAIGPDSTLYVGSEDGYLYALESSSDGSASPWPKSRHDNRNTGRFTPGVWATTIVAPQDSAIVHGMTPAAYFKNTNVEPAKDFYCHCEIWPTYSDTLPLLSPPYHCEYWISYELNPGDSVLVTFSPWQSDDSSTYSARFYATDVFSTTRTLDFRGSAGISEPPSSPVTQPVTHLEISSPTGRGIVLRYSLSLGETGTLKLFDASGRMVSSVSVQGQGEAKVAGLSAGVYFARLESVGAGVTKKIVVVR